MVAMSLRIRSSFDLAIMASSEPPPGGMARSATDVPVVATVIG